MTIDELLAMAAKCVQLAYDAMDTDYTADPAMVAQAAAQTAQAMILDTACSKGQSVNDKPAYWLRVDTGN